jgi:hypothetical protein
MKARRKCIENQCQLISSGNGGENNGKAGVKEEQWRGGVSINVENGIGMWLANRHL